MGLDPVALLAFLPAALALNLTPGADMMFCLAQGLRAGPRAALAASAGISAGVMVHAAAAGLGLAALLAASPASLVAIRWAGAAYLLWLAWSTLRAGAPQPGNMPTSGAQREGKPWRVFRAGLAVNLANPKVILFVLAFLPQFVAPARGAVLVQFLALGALLALGGFAINGAVGLMAGGIAARLARDARLGRAFAVASAGVFVALALRLALMQKG